MNQLGTRTRARAGESTSGDPHHFADWVTPHWVAMMRTAHRLSPTDWEDVVQDALADAWRKWSSFDSERGTARSWLVSIVVDRAYKRSRRPSVVGKLASQPTAPVADLAASTAARVDLQQALGTLTRRQRSAVELFYFVDLSVAEVAAVLDCSVGTVKSTLAAARAHLETQLGMDYC